MRRLLDTLYNAAAYLAALLLIGTLAMVLLGIFGRMFGFQVRGTDAYAGYCMAGAGFLALAHTLTRGDHIRVSLILEHAGVVATGQGAGALVAGRGGRVVDPLCLLQRPACVAVLRAPRHLDGERRDAALAAAARDGCGHRHLCDRLRRSAGGRAD